MVFTNLSGTLLSVPALKSVVRPPAGPAGGVEARGGGGIAVSGASCGRAGAEVSGGRGDDGGGVKVVATTSGVGLAKEQFKVFDPGGG